MDHAVHDLGIGGALVSSVVVGSRRGKADLGIGGAKLAVQSLHDDNTVRLGARDPGGEELGELLEHLYLAVERFRIDTELLLYGTYILLPREHWPEQIRLRLELRHGSKGTLAEILDPRQLHQNDSDARARSDRTDLVVIHLPAASEFRPLDWDWLTAIREITGIRDPLC